MKKKNWFKGIISSVVLSIISSAIYDFIKSKPILSSFLSFLKTIWNFIIKVFDFDLKFWWVVLFFVIYKIIKQIVKTYKAEKIPELPTKYANYTGQKFTNWLWKWDWVWKNNEWKISNLTAYCSKCDIELLNKSDIIEQRAVCPRCNKIYTGYNNEIDDTESVKSVILDNVKKNRY